MSERQDGPRFSRQLAWLMVLAVATALAMFWLLHQVLQQRSASESAQLRQTYNAELARQLGQLEQALAMLTPCNTEPCAPDAFQQMQREFPWLESVDVRPATAARPDGPAIEALQRLAGMEEAAVSGRAVYAAANDAPSRDTVRVWVARSGEQQVLRTATLSAQRLVSEVNAALTATERPVVATVARPAANTGVAMRQEHALAAAGIHLELSALVSDQVKPDTLLSAIAVVLGGLLVVSAGWIRFEALRRLAAEERMREQEERLQNSAKLTTLGEVASTLSHELNQPLAAIESFAATAQGLMLRQQITAPQLQACLQQIRAQVERSDRIIRSVHGFLRGRPNESLEFDLAETINDLRALIDLQAKRHGVSVEVRCEPHVRVCGDRTLIEQAMLNLARNGIEAMCDTHSDRRRLVITVERAALAGNGEAFAQVSVIDQGSGVPVELRERIFLPFVSTKANGLGIGLAICKSAAEKHRGDLSLHDLPGGGTVFRLMLPCSPDQAATTTHPDGVAVRHGAA